MLVLSRKPGEAVRIGSTMTIRVVSVSGQRVRIAIEAPPEVAVHREEVVERIAQANQAAAGTGPEELASILCGDAAQRTGEGDGGWNG